MRRTALALLVLTALLPLPSTAATITVRSGQTLSDIAADYDISVRQLMRMNGIRDSDFVEAGRRLTVPGPQVTAGPGRHLVSRGEALSTIAARYKVSSRDLMLVNNLRNANHVEVGQTLKLPSNAVIALAKPKPAPIRVIPGASQHMVRRGQTLTQIARAYKLPVATLVELNAISNPNKVKVGSTLYLKTPEQSMPESSLSESSTSELATSSVSTTPSPVATKTRPRPAQEKPTEQQPAAGGAVVAKGADWKTYGPLQVDWANWQTMGDSQVVPTLNAAGQPLYVAVNCGARKINVTGADGGWKAWASPKSRFEKKLVEDSCSSQG